MQNERADPSPKYAEALLALGQAADSLVAIEAAITDTLSLLRRNPDVRRFMSDPAIRIEGKCNAIQDLVGEHVPTTLLHFLLILTKAGDLERLPDIANSFFAKASDLRQKETGELTSAVTLSPEKVAAIEAAVGTVLNKEVSLRVAVDPGLLGGMLVKVGDFVFDGTVGRQLEESRRALQA